MKGQTPTEKLNDIINGANTTRPHRDNSPDSLLQSPQNQSPSTLILDIRNMNSPNVSLQAGPALKSFWRATFFDKRTFSALLTIPAVATALLGAFLPTLWDHLSSWPARSTAIIVFVATVALPTVLNTYREKLIEKEVQREEKDEDDITKELVGLLQSYIPQALEGLPDLQGKGTRGPEFKLVKEAILGTVRSICGSPKNEVRAVWFDVDGNKLVAAENRGREMRTHREFSNRNTKNNASGNEVWETAKLGTAILYPNLSNPDERPKHYQRPSGPIEYETFITCGIVDANGQVLGMLNIDAREAGSLTEVDRAIVGLCARIASVAYSLA
ncbi:hypothetical protein BKH23_05905 [Actinomyces oris]|uniref:GAF domain-containing protein n=1 Tax=Actinomyces TaxID=1654 RepID=UPI00094D6F20|nr:MULTISPECIES: GAF domain-containing protein [Actinomyces]OLO61669.1 hypothetical protein BKH23_05905 [Actinomyces oris]